jgi:hypothetical protein
VSKEEANEPLIKAMETSDKQIVVEKIIAMVVRPARNTNMELLKDASIFSFFIELSGR